MEGRKELLVLIILCLSSMAFAVDISDCTNLSYENTTYTLTANVVQGVPTSACFNITANNVTLDCAGYSIALNGTGITIDGVNHSTVKNCVFPFQYNLDNSQINVTNASNVILAESSFSCILLDEVNNATLTYLNVTDQNCRLTGVNQFAISFKSVNNSILANSRISSQSFGEGGVGNNYSLRIDNQSNSNQVFNNFFMLDWNNEEFSAQTGCLGGDDAGIGNSYIYIEPGAPLTNQFNTTLQEGTRVDHQVCIGSALPCSTYSGVNILSCSSILGCTNNIGVEGCKNGEYWACVCSGTSAPCSSFGAYSPYAIGDCAGQPGCSLTTQPIPGILIGGNYYERRGCSAFGLPDAEGLSSLCADADQNGFCDSAFGLAGSAYTCFGTPFCDYPTSENCTDGTFNPICTWAETACGGTCAPCPDLSFDEGTCNLQSGCSWNGTDCEGTCQTCDTYPNKISCQNQLGCSWSANPDCHVYNSVCNDFDGDEFSCLLYSGCSWDANTSTCNGNYTLRCEDLTVQNECQNQTGCNWGINATNADYLPYSNKYAVPSGGGGGFVPTPSVPAPSSSASPPSLISGIRNIVILGIRLTIWLIIIAILIILFDFEIVGKGKKFSVLGFSGICLLVFALVVELLPVAMRSASL